jgi:hypothetical protein
LRAIERDFNGERIAAASAATNEDGAMQASYHRSIFQFRKHADGRVLQAPLLAPLPWSDMFVRKVERAGDGLPTEGDESVMSAELRSQLYRQHCARINAVCDATIAESQAPPFSLWLILCATLCRARVCGRRSCACRWQCWSRRAMRPTTTRSTATWARVCAASGPTSCM